MGIQINGQTDTVTATDGSINVGGDVTIPGVLTYEDVTNIDSIGIGTFRNGIDVTGGSVGIGTDTTDRQLAVYHATQGTIEIKSSDNGQSSLWFSDISDGNVGGVYYEHSNNAMGFRANDVERLRITSTGKCEVYKGTSTTGKTSGSEAFTVGNGANNKRFSVYPDGSTVIGGQGTIGNYNILLQNDGQSYFGARMKIGTTTEGEANADDLTIATSAHTGMTIRSGTANRGNIYFSDGTSGDAEYRGYITYDHDGDKFKFGTANADRLVITSDGKFAIGNSSPEGMLTIEATAAEPPTSGTTANSAIQLYSSLSNHMNFGLNTVNGGYGGYIQVSDNNHAVNYQLNLNPNGGSVIVGSNVAQAHANMDDLQVGDGSGNRGITISSGTSNYGTVAFGDSSDGSGTDRYAGFVEYYHDDNSMRFGTSSGEKVRILNDGTITTGGLSSTPGTVAAGSFVQAAANAGFFSNGIDGKFGTASSHPLYLQVNGVSKATITTGGAFSVGTTSPQQPNVPSMHLHSTANDDARIAITTPNKPNSRIGYFGLSNKFGMDVHNGFEVRDASASYATRFAINSTGVVTFGGQSYATATKSGGVNVSNSVYFDITGSNHVFVKIMIKVGYTGNSNYQMHAQYDYATCNYSTSGATATRTDILQVEAANAQFNYSDISITRPSNRTVRVIYAPSSGAGTHHPILYVSGVFDSITVS